MERSIRAALGALMLIMLTGAADPLTMTHVHACGQGKLFDCSFEVKFGDNPSVGTTVEPVWHGGAVYTFVDTAETLNIVSDDVNDAAAGTGARTVVVVGQAAGEWVNETVTLNGTTNVLTTVAFDYVYRMYVLTAGTAAPNNAAVGGSVGSAGEITATTSTGAKVLGVIGAGDNITHQAIVRVPNNEKWQLVGVVMTTGQGKEVVIENVVRVPGTDIYQTKETLHIVEGEFLLEDHRVFPSGTDFIVTSRTLTGTASVSVFIQMMRYSTNGQALTQLP